MSTNKLLYNFMKHSEHPSMKREKKKHPSDYPQMAFRVSEEDKQRLAELLEQVHRAANKKVADDEKRVKKNELIVSALFTGLEALRKRYGG